MDDVQGLLAIEAIKQLRARYIRCLDTKDWAGFERVFCQDATADYGEAQVDPVTGRTIAEALGGSPELSRIGELTVGSAAIAKGVADGVSDQVTVHHVYSPEIEITSPTSAKGVWALEDICGRVTGAQGMTRGFRGYGHYHETYEKVAGRWLIKSLRVTRLYIDFIE